MFDELKFSPRCTTSITGTIQNEMNGLKSVVILNKAATTFEATSAAADGKVRTCHHPLQVPYVTIHMYPALQLMQGKVLSKMIISQMTS